MIGNGSTTDIQRWLVYSTFDQQGRFADYCAEQLQAYRALGLKLIVVDTSPVITPERELCWSSLATHWFQRENVGYDFGSYRAGFDYLTQHLRVPAHRIALILANDSCYGPYTPLGELLNLFDAQPAGDLRVFGVTESLYYFRHLQSYWIYFRPEVTAFAAEFFATAPPIVDRETAVEHGELGLSKFLVEHGCQLVVPHSSEELLDRFSQFRFSRLLSILELCARRLVNRPRYSRNGDAACVRRYLGMYHAFNPTAAFGVEMHVRRLSPFIKRQLLRENPNADRLVPVLLEEEILINEKVFRAIRRTPLFTRRYGTVEAARTHFPVKHRES